MMDIPFIDNPSPLSIFVALVALFLAIFYFVHNRQGIPPGPVGLPYLGVWPFISDKTCHLKLEAYSRKYGDVSSFTCMGKLFINLGDVRAAREAHITKADCFESRVMSLTVLQSVFKNGLFNVNGEEWKVQRKFVSHSVKERGVRAMTNRSSESVTDVIKSFIKELKDTKGQPVSIVDMLTTKCTSTLRLTLFGNEGLSLERATDIIKLYELIVGGMSPTNVLLVGNFAKYCILPFKSNFSLAQKSYRTANKLLHDIIDEHKASYSEDNIRDIIDDFIKERNTRQKIKDPAAKYFTDDSLAGNLLQLIGDGALSVSMQIGVFIKSLVQYPLEQEKIYQEMMEVVGPDRLPIMDDKPNMPYLNAFTLETLRTSDLFPLLPAMECTKETTLRGYRIPKGALMLLSFWSAHNNPRTYGDPRKFDPSRFLSRDGKMQTDLPMHFGVGKRSCPGEPFSMAQIFLFLSAIVKNFKLSMKEDTNATLFELLLAGKFKIQAHPRT